MTISPVSFSHPIQIPFPTLSQRVLRATAGVLAVIKNLNFQYDQFCLNTITNSSIVYDTIGIGFLNSSSHGIYKTTTKNSRKRRYDEMTTSHSKPLHLAVKSGNVKEVIRLLRKGEFINACDSEKSTPLHLAIEQVDEEIATILIDHGAEIDIQNNQGLTPLHISIIKENLSLSALLLARDAKVNVKDLQGVTPLHFACSTGNAKLVSLLLKNGAQKDLVDSKQRTPLHWAAKHGQVKTASFLLHPNLLEMKDHKGLTALRLAVEHHELEMIRLLLIYGADVNTRDLNENTPLHAALKGDYTLSIIKLLLTHNADANAYGENRETPLHLVAEAGTADIASHLLDFGADIEAQNFENFTPLHIASIFGNITVHAFLLSKNANVNALTDQNETPCHLILSKMSDYLLDRYTFSTFLDDLRIVSQLLLHGTDLTINDIYQETVIDKISDWRTNEILGFVLATKRTDIEKLLQAYDFLGRFNDSSNLLVPLIPPLYLCLANFVPNYRNKLPEITDLLTDEQLSCLVNIWKGCDKNYLDRLSSYSSQTVCRITQWMDSPEIEKVKDRIQKYLQELTELSHILKLGERLKTILSKTNSQDLEALQLELNRLMRTLSIWTGREERITSLLGIFLHAHIVKTYSEVCSMHQALAEFQREEYKNQPFLEEEIDIFSYLFGLQIATPAHFQEILGCPPNQLYSYGLFCMKDLAVIGLNHDLEVLIDEVISGAKEIKEMILWKERNKETIEMISSSIPSSSNEKALGDHFLNMFDDVCENPTSEKIASLKKADQQRRITCLRAYLAQKGVTKLLNNEPGKPENSLSEWVEKNPRKPAFFYSIP